MNPEIIKSHIEELSEGNNNTNESLERYEHLRITDKTQIETPVPVITIGGEIISTPGNITVISGGSKAGKSGLIGVIIAGAISKDENIDGFEYLRIEPNRNSHAVVHFDTEQAKHKHQKNIVSILDRAYLSGCPDHFFSYNLRELDIENYAEITSGICEAANKKCSGVYLIVVDGIADFIKDVNNTEQANGSIKFFLDLSSRFNCPIICIIHTNPGKDNDKERGHQGSQAQRKCESLLHLKTDGEVSSIEPKLLRMAGKGDIPEIRFTWDKEKGYHVSCDGKATSAHTDKKSMERIAMLQTICNKVFGGQEALGYGDAYRGIMKAAKNSEVTAKKMLTEMQVHEMVMQAADKKYRLNVESV